MVLGGVAVLANFQWSELRLGRGEAESILGSLFFTAQILWLERSVFTGNRSSLVTMVMFAVVASLLLPVALLTGNGVGEWIALYNTGVAIGIILFLTLACTLICYGLMNHWQSHIPATHASLIYCSEPLFTSVFALFLPEYLAGLAKINYANEHVTLRLLVGGGLITAANLLVLWQSSRLKKVAPLPVDDELQFTICDVQE